MTRSMHYAFRIKRIIGVFVVGSCSMALMTPQAQADEFSLRPQYRQDEGSADSGEAQSGGDSAEELAKKLQNPVAELISIPIQSSFNFNQGPDGDGYQFQFQVKPVVPFKLNDEWNLISRGIFTLTYRDGDVLPGQGSEWGLGDTLLQAFFSPRSSGGLIWGVGPAIICLQPLTTSSDRRNGVPAPPR